MRKGGIEREREGGRWKGGRERKKEEREIKDESIQKVRNFWV